MSRSVRLKELAWLFFKLGTIGFGGPAAHIAMMEDEVVRRRGWLSHEKFIDLVPSSRSGVGQRPGSYQPGATPQASGQNQPPSANGADQVPKSLSTGSSFPILPATPVPYLNRLRIGARFQL